MEEEEKPEEMAAGNPGSSAPLSPNESGYSGVSLPSDAKKLSSMQLRKLKMFRADEVKANEQADLAIREADRITAKRDEYCKELEKQHGLTGYSWDVDWKTGAIIVGAKRG